MTGPDICLTQLTHYDLARYNVFKLSADAHCLEVVQICYGTHLSTTADSTGLTSPPIRELFWETCLGHSKRFSLQTPWFCSLLIPTHCLNMVVLESSPFPQPVEVHSSSWNPWCVECSDTPLHSIALTHQNLLFRLKLGRACVGGTMRATPAAARI